MTLVFVEDLDEPALLAEDRHHVERVLRTRVGEMLVAADGHGRSRLCRLEGGGRLRPVGEVEVDAEPDPRLTVAFAVTKGPRPELVVQKLTELGVDRIVPFLAARSVARWEGDRAERHVARLRRVAREAAMQCHRSRLPEVAEVTEFATVAALPGAVLADRDGAPPTLETPTVLIGPEGGWTEEERAGARAVGLGRHVLRAETAAIAAAAVLGALRSGLVVPAGH